MESTLGLLRSQAALIIQYRDKHGKFKSLDDLKKVAGAGFFEGRSEEGPDSVLVAMARKASGQCRSTNNWANCGGNSACSSLSGGFPGKWSLPGDNAKTMGRFEHPRQPDESLCSIRGGIF
jgi:hypothetical protein